MAEVVERSKKRAMSFAIGIVKEPAIREGVEYLPFMNLKNLRGRWRGAHPLH